MLIFVIYNPTFATLEICVRVLNFENRLTSEA